MRTQSSFKDRIPSLKYFSDLDAEVLAFIANRSRVGALPPKETLFERGFSPYDVYILIEGIIVSEKSRSSHGTPLFEYIPGDIVGLLPAINRRPYDETAVTLSRCYFAFMKVHDFAELTKQPGISGLIFRQLADQTDRLRDEITRDRIPDAVGRLSAFLLDMAGLYGKSAVTNRILLPEMPRDYMAQRLGVSAMTVIRGLSELEKGNYIVRRVRNIEIPNVDNLRRVVALRLGGLYEDDEQAMTPGNDDVTQMEIPVGT